MTHGDCEVISKYFTNLSDVQKSQFSRLGALYTQWNEKINLISRKDIPNLYLHHVLHSLGIAKVIEFAEGTRVMDVGTGGGFPGIPLAILFPNVAFHLVDATGKKIAVVKDIAANLQLANVTAQHTRAENVTASFDFVVSRAVTALPVFYGWVKNKIRKTSNVTNVFPNGIFYLKGGDLTEELHPLGNRIQVFALKKFFEEDFFETKKVVYCRCT